MEIREIKDVRMGKKVWLDFAFEDGKIVISVNRKRGTLAWLSKDIVIESDGENVDLSVIDRSEFTVGDKDGLPEGIQVQEYDIEVTHSLYRA